MVSLCSVFLLICKATATVTVRYHFRNLRIVTNNLTHCAELKVLILNNFVWKWQIHVFFCVRLWKDRAYTIEWWILLVRFYEGTKRSAPLWAMLLRCFGSNVSFWRLSLYFLPTFLSDLFIAFPQTQEGFNVSWTVWSFFETESSSLCHFRSRKCWRAELSLWK